MKRQGVQRGCDIYKDAHIFFFSKWYSQEPYMYFTIWAVKTYGSLFFQESNIFEGVCEQPWIIYLWLGKLFERAGIIVKNNYLFGVGLDA